MSNHSNKPKRAITIRHDPRVIRDMIEQNQGSYGAVAFVKKDGTIRKLTFQRGNDAAYVAGTELGQRMSAAFHANTDNAHKMRLRDVDVMRRNAKLPEDQRKTPWRTVDLSRVYSLRANGVTMRFK